MISKIRVKQFCCEDPSKIYGYNEAIADKDKIWHLHHCLGLVWSKEKLIEMGLYYNQPAERLMFVTPSEHLKLHYLVDEERKQKISSANKGKLHPTGKPAWNRGKSMSEESRKKLSNSLKGKTSPNKGKHFSEETRKNMCEAHAYRRKQVYQYTKDGKLVKVWDSVRLVIKAGYTHVSAVCNGKRKTDGGFIWSYIPLN